MSDGHTFVIGNRGPAEAGEAMLRARNEDPVSMGQLPITVLAAGQPFTIHSDTRFTMAGTWEGHLEWQDSAGPSGSL
jgi:hypothetical protein